MTIVLLFSGQISAQDKLVINDHPRLLNAAVESSLSDRLSADSIILTSMIDNRKRCEYWFVTLVKEKDDLMLSVADCNDRSAGSRNMGSLILSATDAEKATLLYFALSEILKDPYDRSDEKATAQKPVPEGSGEEAAVDPDHHSSRYFFSPSSMNVKKGDIYYNTLYFLLHDVQFGVSDQFSIGMGTTIAGFPFYLTPKISITVDDRNSFAVGDMLMIGTWGAKFTGNLLYGTYTRGDAFNNFTVGAGYLSLGGGDVTDKINAPVVNFSGLARLSDRMFFITENYMSGFVIRDEANYYSYNPVTYEGIYRSESFRRNVFFIYGSTGFRFINKVRDLRSWQFGLSYLFSSYEAVPGMFTGSNWYVGRRDTKKLVAFPVIGYARKFSL